MTNNAACQHRKVVYTEQEYCGDGYTSVGTCDDCGTVLERSLRHTCGGRYETDASGLIDTCTRCGYGRA